MPKVSTDIPNHQDYITRPIATKIASEVIGYSGLNVKDLIFLGSAAQAMNKGSAIDDPTALAAFSESNQVKVTIEEEFRPESFMTSGILSGYGRTVFHDKESKVYLLPVKTDATMTLELTYSAPTEAEARNWINRMQQALERRLEITTHSIPYSYPIPHEYVAAIKAVHGLRETGPGAYGQDLGTYLRDKFSGKVGVRSKLNGKGKQFVVEETQHDVLGTLDFDEVPKPSKDGLVYTVSFNYTIRYERPFAMVLDYPLVINNNLITSELMPKVDYNEKLRIDSSTIRNWSDGIVNIVEPTTSKVGGYSLPSFDAWRVPHPPRDTGSVFRLLITVDPLDTGLILDLNDLGEYALNPDIINLMRASGSMLFEYAHCPVLVTLYENDRPVTPSDLSMEGTSLRVNGRTLNPRFDYHLRIALITNLAMLSEPASDLMLLHPKAARAILLALEPTLITEGLMPRIYNNRLDEIEYRKAVEYVNFTAAPYSALGEVDRVRVAFMTIAPQRS